MPVFAPMTPSVRLHDYLKNAFSPSSLAESGASAGIDQWSNHPVEWGQGSTGYARRDDGSRRVSVSRFSGTVGAAFVSRIWQPADTNGTGEAFAGFALSNGKPGSFPRSE